MIPDEQAWEAAAALLDAAGEALAAERLGEAEALSRRALAELTVAVGADHPDAGNACATLAEVLLLQGRFEEALPLLDRAVQSCLPWVGEAAADPIRWRALGLRADALTRLADYSEARAVLDGLLAELDPRSPEATVARGSLGVLLRFQGQWTEAEAQYLQVLAATPEGERCVVLHNLAGLAAARGDFAASERWARQALATHRDRRTRRYATDLAGLADALAGQGRSASAAANYRRAIDLLVAINPNDPEIAYARHNLGDALAAAGEHREAEAAYQDALARKRVMFGERHPEIAGTLNNLAALHADQGRMAEARSRSAEAVAAVQDLALDHPIRVGVLAFASSLPGPG